MDPSKPDQTIARIRVRNTGEIWFDDRRVTIEQLRSRLADLRARDGAVWYYRETGMLAPPPEAMAVIQLVIECRLPISMSTQPDFSDVVRPDGSVGSRFGPHTLS